MLEGVVQEDDVRHVFAVEQLPNAIHTVFVHRDLNLGKLPEILQRFVANNLVGALLVSELEAFGLSAVATTERCYAVGVAQYINEVFHGGRFSRPAKVEVAHANYRLLESCDS